MKKIIFIRTFAFDRSAAPIGSKPCSNSSCLARKRAWFSSQSAFRRSNARGLFILVLYCVLSVPAAGPAAAFWVWTPETNKWVNPKYSVKETPAEQFQYALGFYSAKEYKEAVQEMRKLIGHYPKAREAADAQFYIGVCLEDQGRLHDAFKEYQTVIDKYPFSERSSEIVQKQYDIGIKLLEGKGNRGVISRTFAGSDDTIVDIFNAVIKNAPYGKLAAPARYKIGLYLSQNDLHQEARDEFEKVINDYPDSEWAKAAKYQIALSDAKRSTAPQYDQKITQAAAEEFKEFVEHYPDADLSVEAREQIHRLKEKEAESNFKIAAFYEKQKKYSAAKIYYQIIADEFKHSRLAADALRKIQELNQKIQQ